MIVARDGLDMGIKIRHKICHWLAPSSFADSSSLTDPAEKVHENDAVENRNCSRDDQRPHGIDQLCLGDNVIGGHQTTVKKA